MKIYADNKCAKRKSGFPYKCTHILADVVNRNVHEIGTDDSDIRKFFEQQFEQIFGIHDDSNEGVDE